ncbi:MAG: S8/S53 family peptidase [Planctomycetes bacterium]|nr:S8/S53 family peptidase [Planctomycetota bacterium]
MNYRYLSRLTLPLLVTTAFLGAQDQTSPKPVGARPMQGLRFDLTQHGRAGAQPDTEQWIVTMQKRSFDLSEARAALRDGRREEIGKALVEKYERLVVVDQQPFEDKLKALGGRILRRWWINHGCLIEVPRAKLQDIAKMEEVATLEPEIAYAPLRSGGASMYIPSSTDASNHNADAVQASGERGANAIVAIMDGSFDSNYQSSGQPHQTFFRNGIKTAANNLLPTSNQHRIGAQAFNIPDLHGTGVASVAAGSAWTGLFNSDGHAPDAQKVGYSIADFANGNSNTSTLQSAWQTMFQHKLTNVHDIKVANNSYSGSPNPTNAVQQALDALANDMDVLVTVAAGNDGNTSNPAGNSQSCVNGLAVGACSTYSKVMASFSSFGPLPNAACVNRSWPDITGCGAFALMARHSDESSYYGASGTSFAAPQVAGAATLVRSTNPALSALETKAILLASTESIASQNPTMGVNNFGQGFLRDDLAVDLARRASTNVATWFHTTNSLGADCPFPMEVTQGRVYTAVCVWNRTAPYNNTNWGDFRMRVMQYQPTFTTIADSYDPNTVRTLYRKVTFTAPLTGRLWIVCSPQTVQNLGQPNYFAVAHTGESVEGNVTAYGQGCAGTGPFANGTILPAANATAMGNTRSLAPVTDAYPGSSTNRVQQLLQGSEQPVARTYTGVSFRQDDGVVANPPGGSVEIQIRMGYTTRTINTLSSTFANNFTSGWTTVLPRQWITLPPVPAAPNTNPASFLFTIPFDNVFSYTPQVGRNVLIEFSVFNNEIRDCGVTTANPGEARRSYWVDSVMNGNTAIVYGSTTFGTGSIGVGRGSVLRLEHVDGTGATPRLSTIGWPGVGRPVTFFGEQCLQNSGVLLNLGLSRTMSGTTPLPFDMTPLGAPGCFVLASNEASLFLVADSVGRVRNTWNIPNSPSNLGVKVFAQIGSFDIGANSFGMAVSHALELTIGDVGIHWQ